MIDIIGDLHLHDKPEWRFDLLKEKLSTYKNREVWLLGDVFEVKDKINCDVINIIIDFCLNNDVIWLVGQHDSHKPNICSLEGLKSKVKIVSDSVLEHKGFYFVPFHRDLKVYRDWLIQIPDNAKIMTHIPLEEAIHHLNPNFVGLNMDDFKRFSLVVSGDIHNGQVFEKGNCKFIYTGVYAPRDFRDKGYQGKFIRLEDGKLNRIGTDMPIFVDIKSQEQLDQLTDKQLIIRSNVDLNCGNNVIENSKNIIKNNEVKEMIEVQNVSKYVQQYLLNTQTTINKEFLTKIYQEL